MTQLGFDQCIQEAAADNRTHWSITVLCPEICTDVVNSYYSDHDLTARFLRRHEQFSVDIRYSRCRQTTDHLYPANNDTLYIHD